jgi:hypothetical protein
MYLFGIMFEEIKSAFNIQNVHLKKEKKKRSIFGKKIKSVFKGLKMIKTHFKQKA